MSKESVSIEEMEKLGTLTKADVKFLLRCRVLNFGMFDTVVIKEGSPALARRSEPQEIFDN